ncbi:hypothetical protein MRY87_07440 [bacterium]|nr:hypothetical protein [bacterium]
MAQCEAAMRGGYPLDSRPGKVIGRGFADVGYEVFLVLPNRMLLSLLTGEQSPLRDEEGSHYFSVPSVEEVVARIEEGGSQLTRLLREDRRTWSVGVEGPGGDLRTESGAELLSTLLTFFSAERGEKAA